MQNDNTSHKSPDQSLLVSGKGFEEGTKKLQIDKKGTLENSRTNGNYRLKVFIRNRNTFQAALGSELLELRGQERNRSAEKLLDFSALNLYQYTLSRRNSEQQVSKGA